MREAPVIRWLREQDAKGRAECWLYPKTTEGGYGRAHLRGRQRFVHRVSYELFVGPIPPGYHVDHALRNEAPSRCARACANPDHLEAVPPRVNVLRGMSPAAQHARKTLCKNGHPFTPGNLETRKGRSCRICARARQRARYHAKKEVHRARNAEWRARNREKIAAYDHARRSANRDAINERRRELRRQKGQRRREGTM